MLVLTRKTDEKILVGDDIVITVTRISPGKCKLGLDAPDTIRIRRWEHVSLEERQALKDAGLTASVD